MSSMFCYQCEQAAKGTGCTSFGVCGKDPETSTMQDLLTHTVKEISRYAHRAAQAGEHDRTVDRFVLEALFTTVTNVNFDPQRINGLVDQSLDMISRARRLYEQACAAEGKTPEAFQPVPRSTPGSYDERIRQGEEIGIEAHLATLGADVTSLQELLLYGLKGMAAYADHALILGQEDDAVYAFFHEALAFLTRTDATADELTAMVLRCGEVNLRVMEMLDTANTGAYGHPEPTKVRVTPVKGKCILVSGHDLKDLAELLKQTEGTGISVYTHSEMLPAHAYPELKKYAHLAGNYGGAWQDQQKEFDAFPGAILMTTNCLQKPRHSYWDRIFTCGLVAWPDIPHITNRDFAPVIAAAQAAPGFEQDEPEQTITVGFGHNTVLGVADQVIDAVKAGKIRHFFLVGGCDGAKSGRNYYTDFAQAVPDDCVIMTLACGKYRFNKLPFGDIGGIPRLLDIGQCNDAYSAIRIASALADAFDCGVNDLPLSMVLSWYEQKAVVILLTLLHLGIKDIRLGPSLPAFITPAVLQVLVDNFGLKPITTVEEDLAACLGA